MNVVVGKIIEPPQIQFVQLDKGFLNSQLMLTWLFNSQLEDDIVAKPNYFATMKNFAMQLASEDWMILEFSQLGFIGMTML